MTPLELPQCGASLTDACRVIIYDCNMFQVTGLIRIY
jgi:hypothetical protein